MALTLRDAFMAGASTEKTIPGNEDFRERKFREFMLQAKNQNMEIYPCPRCQLVPRLVQSFGEWYVVCDQCDVISATRRYTKPTDAILAWNEYTNNGFSYVTRYRTSLGGFNPETTYFIPGGLGRFRPFMPARPYPYTIDEPPPEEPADSPATWLKMTEVWVSCPIPEWWARIPWR